MAREEFGGALIAASSAPNARPIVLAREWPVEDVS